MVAAQRIRLQIKILGTMSLDAKALVLDIEDLDLDAVYYDAATVDTVRASLLDWYSANRRRLPWRGDAPPFGDDAAPPPSKKQKFQRRPAGVAAISSYFSAPAATEATASASAPPRIAAGDSTATPSARGPLTVTPYATWVSEIMLQQTRVATVIDYHTRWLARFPTIEALAAASPEDVNAAWAGLGYYRRARFLHACAKEVVAHHGGALPSTAAELIKLPGIGPYTAGAVASIAFGESTPVVDGNVVRVLARHRALADDAKSRKLAKLCWRLAGELVPRCDAGIFNQAVMELGATVCTPKSPSCGACPIRASCHGAASSAGAAAYPIKHVKKAPRDEGVAVCAVRRERDGRLLCQRRPSTGLLAGQWELICAVLPQHAPPPTLVARRAALAAKLGRSSTVGAALVRLVGGDDEREGGAVGPRLPSAPRRRDLQANSAPALCHVFSHIKHHMFIEIVVLTAEAEIEAEAECTGSTTGAAAAAAAAAEEEEKEAVRWMSEAELKLRGVTTGLRKVLKRVQSEEL